jgi:aminoglycoside phosphotransferase (APT) family kinase protein
MSPLARRDDGELVRGLTRWYGQVRPGEQHEVVELARPKAGWSNETLLVTTRSRRGGTDHRERVVVRLPPSLPTWPAYDLGAQARVLDALATQGIPVPTVIAFEQDEQWVGAPFLVMTHEPGRPGAEVPAFDPWLVDAPVDEQRRLHESFVNMLAAIHRVDWRAPDLTRTLRGGEDATKEEVGWWRGYIEWAADGDPTPALAEAIAWCAATVPGTEPPASLCWGDARIGNVLFCDDDDAPGSRHLITSVLDWELATIGPAEMDLAWYLALDELTTSFTHRTVAGFLDRAELVHFYEHALGREVRDLAWHEIFALTRSVAINERQARMAATTGVAYPGVAGEQNPVLPHLAAKIDAFGG